MPPHRREARLNRPRQILPKAPQEPAPTAPLRILLRQKRHQVQRACERCRSRKAKCDGVDPCCGPCNIANCECIYSHPNGSIKQRLEKLEAAYTEATRGLGHLSATGSTENQTGSLSSADTALPANTHHTGHQRNIIGQNISPKPLIKLPLSRWTKVSNNDNLLNYLFNLFWTWENTLARIVHRDLLLDSLSAEWDATSGAPTTAQTQFCSEFLVNSILAISMGCFFESTDFDKPPSHHEFAEEAFRLLSLQDEETKLPLIQGIAIMSMYEQSFGNPPRGESLFFDTLHSLQSASRILDVPSADYDDNQGTRSHEIKQAIVFIASGFCCLDAKLKLVLDRTLPASPNHWDRNFRHGDLFFNENDRINESGAIWTPYPTSKQARVSYYDDSLEAEYELTRLTNDILLTINDNYNSPVPDYVGAKNLYGQLLHWKNSKSHYFQSQTCVIPTWLCLIATFHLLSVKLLKPFIGLSFLDFEVGKTARPLSQLHSEGIISSLWNYRTTFGVRPECWLLHACQAAVESLIFNNTMPGTHEWSLSRGCELLYHIGQYMPQANGLILALWREAQTREIELPEVASRFLEAGMVNVRRSTVFNTVPLTLAKSNTGVFQPYRCQISFTNRIEKIHKE